MHSYYIIIPVCIGPADGLAPLGAKASAGTVMTKFVSPA